jgi:hypothetical protein
VAEGEEEEQEEEPLDADAEPLPDREMMSLINGNVVIPINGTLAANVLSEDAIEASEAEQDVDSEQQGNEEEST